MQTFQERQAIETKKKKAEEKAQENAKKKAEKAQEDALQKKKEAQEDTKKSQQKESDDDEEDTLYQPSQESSKESGLSKINSEDQLSEEEIELLLKNLFDDSDSDSLALLPLQINQTGKSTEAKQTTEAEQTKEAKQTKEVEEPEPLQTN